MVASEVSPFDFTLEITASHNTTFYIPSVCVPEIWDEKLVVDETNAALLEGWEYWKSVNGNVMGDFLNNSCYKGNYKITAGGLEPETTVMGYILAIDVKTAQVVKVHVFENLATTKKLGSVEPKMELVGYYSGKEENGAVFGDAEYTASRAITVVKYTNIDGARSLFSAMMGDNVTNVNNYSHSEIWGKAKDYWSSVSTAQPYSFYLTDWDYEQTALAYCVDKQGNPGGIARLYTCATAENKNDINELVDLVNELNAAQKSRLSLPTSLVVNENAGVTFTVVEAATEVAVEAAAQAVVETPAAVNNVVKAGGYYVRPFYI